MTISYGFFADIYSSYVWIGVLDHVLELGRGLMRLRNIELGVEMASKYYVQTVAPPTNSDSVNFLDLGKTFCSVLDVPFDLGPATL